MTPKVRLSIGLSPIPVICPITIITYQEFQGLVTTYKYLLALHLPPINETTSITTTVPMGRSPYPQLRTTNITDTIPAHLSVHFPYATLNILWSALSRQTRFRWLRLRVLGRRVRARANRQRGQGLNSKVVAKWVIIEREVYEKLRGDEKREWALLTALAVATRGGKRLASKEVWLSDLEEMAHKEEVKGLAETLKGIWLDDNKGDTSTISKTSATASVKANSIFPLLEPVKPTSYALIHVPKVKPMTGEVFSAGRTTRAASNASTVVSQGPWTESRPGSLLSRRFSFSSTKLGTGQSFKFPKRNEAMERTAFWIYRQRNKPVSVSPTATVGNVEGASMIWFAAGLELSEKGEDSDASEEVVKQEPTIGSASMLLVTPLSPAPPPKLKAQSTSPAVGGSPLITLPRRRHTLKKAKEVAKVTRKAVSNWLSQTSLISGCANVSTASNFDSGPGDEDYSDSSSEYYSDYDGDIEDDENDKGRRSGPAKEGGKHCVLSDNTFNISCSTCQDGYWTDRTDARVYGGDPNADIQPDDNKFDWIAFRDDFPLADLPPRASRNYARVGMGPLYVEGKGKGKGRAGG